MTSTPKHFDEKTINELLTQVGIQDVGSKSNRVLRTDVFIAGTGPIGATYARVIADLKPTAKIIMADVGKQDGPIIGGHHKNSVKYQKDIDLFVNVIKGALQFISVPSQDSFIPTLGGQGWRPPPPGSEKQLIFQGNNPDQKPEFNLKASAVTRTVGGMATHWTCACPNPHADERVKNPIPWEALRGLLKTGRTLLKVHKDQYDESVRQTLVKEVLVDHLGIERVENLPLAVERRKDNHHFVTWSSSDTVLGNVVNNEETFTLLAEHRVTRVVPVLGSTDKIAAVLLRDLNADEDKLVIAEHFVICCGAVPTPQILFNSGIRPEPLGRYLCEQSLAFCQIILKKEYIDSIPTEEPFGDYKHSKDAILKHKTKYKNDPLPIPFTDPEPQITLPYSPDNPWHVQIHRDAFSYGEVGPRADSRVVVDLRWFGAQASNSENRVIFASQEKTASWQPHVTDIYGMPQPTFIVQRSDKDLANDQKMMEDMTKVASILGSYLPGSYPQFMDPGLALHITGTTRIGDDPKDSVADANSRVHGIENLWVGGNGCIPDSTACNPTPTSVAIAIKGARAIVLSLWPALAQKVKKEEEEEQKAAAEEEKHEAAMKDMMKKEYEGRKKAREQEHGVASRQN